MYHGDIGLGDTIDIKFTTVNTSGVPTTLAGGPVVSAYPGNSITQLTAGITLTVGFDALTGLHNVRVVATGANGYLTATNYVLVITTGTVGGSSVVGYVIGSFSIENRSALRPTTAGRTLVVDAAGLADANVVKVGPTGAGTVQTAGDIMADTNDIQTRLPAALVAGRIDASVGAMAANVVTAAAINAAALNGKGDWNIGKTGYALSAAGVQAVWDALTSALVTIGSIGKLLVDNINATVSSRSSHTAADVWASATRTLTSFGTLVSDIWANATRTLTGFSTALAVAMWDVLESAIATAGSIGLRLDRSVRAIVLGTVGVGSSTTSIVTSSLDPAAAAVDQFKGRIVIFDKDTTTANLRGQATDITANTALGVLTVTALTTAPANGDTFTIL